MWNVFFDKPQNPNKYKKHIKKTLKLAWEKGFTM